MKMLWLSFALIGMGCFGLGFSICGAMDAQSATRHYNPKDITTHEPGLAYREGILFGQAMTGMRCSTMTSLKDFWIKQGEDNAFDGYRVENGVFKIPGEK